MSNQRQLLPKVEYIDKVNEELDAHYHGKLRFLDITADSWVLDDRRIVVNPADSGQETRQERRIAVPSSRQGFPEFTPCRVALKIVQQAGYGLDSESQQRSLMMAGKNIIEHNEVRLFPSVHITSEREAELRATASLLAMVRAVSEFGGLGQNFRKGQANLREIVILAESGPAAMQEVAEELGLTVVVRPLPESQAAPPHGAPAAARPGGRPLSELSGGKEMTRNRTYELLHTVEHDEMSYPIDEEGWGNALKVAQFHGWPPEHSCPEWYVEPDARLVSEEEARSMGQALGKVVDDLPNLPSDGRTVLERMGGFAKQDSKAFVTFLMRCSFTINKGV